MDPRHKDLEEYYLSSFLSNELMNHMVGSMIMLDNDPPDSILQTDESKVSIEIGRVYNPKLKEQENIQNRVVKLALEKFNLRRRDTLRVFVQFSSKHLSPNYNFSEKLSDELSEYVERVCAKNEGHKFSISTLSHSCINDYFSRISLSNEYNYENWQPFGAYLVEYVDEVWFRKIIDKKEGKMKEIGYEKEFDENWLLLVADFGHKSSAFRFDSLASDYNDSLFDKIYLYQKFSDKIFEIK